MSMAKNRVPAEGPPAWAIDRAAAELYDVDDSPTILARARKIASEVDELEDERHDEYDDHDRGGEG
jgi:hypothetical protein